MSSGSIRQVWSDAELDEALATLHSGPGVRQDELARTRAALMRAAGEVEDELLPVSEPERPAKKRPGSWRWIAAAAAAALVPGGVVVATNIFVDNGQDTATHATSVPSGDILNNLRGADLILRDGQFRYMRDSTWTTWFGKNSKVIYQTHEITERWRTSDLRQKSKLRSTRTGEIRWLKGDYATAQAHGDVIPGPRSEVRKDAGDIDTFPIGPASTGNPPPSAQLSTTSSERTPSKPTTSATRPEKPSVNDGRVEDSWVRPSTEFLAGLPTDPAKLLDRLRTGDIPRVIGGRPPGSENSAAEIFEMAHSVMRAGYRFGDLRVALCRALAKVPGITVKPDTNTADGRKGISFSVELTDQTREIVVDPATTFLISNRVVATAKAKSAPAGTVLYETITTVAVTDNEDGP